MLSIAERLSPDCARRLTDEVRADAQKLWAKLLQLYEGGAHLALGYSSWGSYFEAEFGQSGTHGYRLLAAARTQALLSDSPIGESDSEVPSLPLPQNEGQVRELARVPEPKERLAAWEQAVANYGPEPTGREVAFVVASRQFLATLSEPAPAPKPATGRTETQAPAVTPALLAAVLANIARRVQDSGSLDRARVAAQDLAIALRPEDRAGVGGILSAEGLHCAGEAIMALADLWDLNGGKKR